MTTEYSSVSAAIADAATCGLPDKARRAFAAALWFEYQGDKEKAMSYLSTAIAEEEKANEAE